VAGVQGPGTRGQGKGPREGVPKTQSEARKGTTPTGVPVGPAQGQARGNPAALVASVPEAGPGAVAAAGVLGSWTQG